MHPPTTRRQAFQATPASIPSLVLHFLEHHPPLASSPLGRACPIQYSCPHCTPVRVSCAPLPAETRVGPACSALPPLPKAFHDLQGHASYIQHGWVVSDARVTPSTPVVSEGMAASGFSLRACTAGWESWSGEDRLTRAGRRCPLLCTAAGPDEASLAVSRGAVAQRAAAVAATRSLS